MKRQTDLSETLDEAIMQLLDTASQLAFANGFSIEEFMENAADAFAELSGEEIADCVCEVTLVDKPASN